LGDTWDSSVVNHFLQNNVKEYRRRYFEMSPTDFNLEGGVSATYTALEDEHEITSVEASDMWIEKVLSVTDVTEASAPYNLKRAVSMRQIKEIRNQNPNGVAQPSHYFYYNAQSSDATGVITRKMLLALGPLPQRQRTIDMEVQGVMSNADDEFDTDASTTGLPTYAEKALVLQTVIDCRMMEENPNTSLLQEQFDKAEREFKVLAKRTDGRDDDMDFDESLLY
jgi:hypothetical protein